MTFTKNADTSITQTGVDDTTLANSTVLADLVAAADPRSFIDTSHIATDTNNNVQTVMVYIPKLTVDGNLNIYVPRTASLFALINGGSQFAANELANFATMKWRGFVKNNDGLNEASYNLILVMGRLSDSYFKQGEAALDLRGQSATFEYLILRLGSPVDAFSSPNTLLNLTGVWIQPLDRSHAFSGNDGSNNYIRYNQQGIFKDVILSTPCTFFNIPDVIENLTLLSLGGNCLAGFNGIDRSGSFTKDVLLPGFEAIGDAHVQSLGSPKIYLDDSKDGTSTRTSSIGTNAERRAGFHFSQHIQFEVRNTSRVLLENAVIRDKETDNGEQAPFLQYCVSDDPVDAYETYDDTTKTNYINTWTSGADGRTNTIRRRQGIKWHNFIGNPNYTDQLPEGEHLDLKCIDSDDNVLFGSYIIGYTIDFKLTQIRYKGDTMVIPVVAIPVPQFIHTEAEISAFTEFDTYVKIFEGIKYWEKMNDEIVNYVGIGNSLITFDGKKLTLADGWDLLLVSGVGDIVVNNVNKSITIPTGGTLTSDDTFNDLVIQGDFVHTDVIVNGLYEYLKLDVELVKSYELAPITSFSSTIKYIIEFYRNNPDGTQTLLHTFNAPDDTPIFFEVPDDIPVTMHIHGGGIARIDDTFVNLPRLIDPTPTLDGDSALIESVEAKIASGEYGVLITKNGNVLTLNLSGTESMANVNTGILYILAKHGVSDYNQGKPSSDRITIGEVMTDYGNSLEMYAVFGTLNNLYFNDGLATSIILNDANESLLESHDFGINSSTSTKFLGTLAVRKDDRYKIDDADYVIVADDGIVSIVLNKADTNLAWIKRDWVELSKHTFSALQPNYEPLVIKTFTDNPPIILNKYEPISDYLEAVDETILHKKNLVDPANDEAATENQYHLRLMNDFDKTFPFGVSGLHVLRTVRDTQLILNYEPTVPTNTTNCTPTVYYENAGVSNGQNGDGSTKYEPYVVQNVGGNFESFEINLHKTTGTYNTAGAMFHNIFSTIGPGNIQEFYVVKANGETELYHAYVNSKTGNIWHMNRGLPGYEIKNGEHITFVKTPATTKTQKDLIYVAMQLAYGDLETVATGYITPLLQEAIVVTSGADIKDDLATIIQKEDQIQGSMDEAISKLELLHENENNFSERENNADGSVNFRVYSDSAKTELIRDYHITTNGEVQSRDLQ